jgi:hypothetical protein
MRHARREISVELKGALNVVDIIRDLPIRERGIMDEVRLGRPAFRRPLDPFSNPSTPSDKGAVGFRSGVPAFGPKGESVAPAFLTALHFSYHTVLK